MDEADGQTATLTVVNSALEPHGRGRETCAVAALVPIAQVLPEPVRADPKWIVVQDGRVLAREEWEAVRTQPGADLLCYPRIQKSPILQIIVGALLVTAGVVIGVLAGWTGIGAIAAGVLISLGVGFIVGGATALIIGPPAVPHIPELRDGDQGSSPTFGFQGIRNQTRIGAPVPVVYGLHRVGGQYLQVYTTNANDDSVLYALLAVSEGEIASISGSEINGQPIANFRGVVTATRLGLNTQSALTLFGDAITAAYAADAALTTTFIVYTTIGTALTAFEILIQFPGGLFGVVKDTGELKTASVVVEVEYKLVTAGGWTALPSVTYTEGKRAVLRRTIRKDGLAAGQYDLRIRRTTAESGSLTLVDAVRRSAINEIVNDAHTYPNTALLGVQAVATDQLSGGLPNITSLVKGRSTLRVLSSLTAFTLSWTQNPAWIVFDMLTNRRYGMGKFIWPVEAETGTVTLTNASAVVTGSGTGWTASTVRKGQKVVVDGKLFIGTVLSFDSATQLTLSAAYGGTTGSALTYEIHRDDLDLQSFLDWATFCAASVSNGAGGTMIRAQVNFVFDADQQAAWDAVLKVAGLGFAAVIKLGNYLRIKFQQAETAAQLFTMANIVRGTFQESFMPLKERANYFEVQYLNEDNNYEQDMVVLEDPAIFDNSEPERRATVSVFGVTRTPHAVRLAKFYAKANRLLTRTIQFEVGIDAVAVEPGDVLNFQHDVPGWGAASRAGTGSTASTIVLDMPVTLGAGTYQVTIRHADDTLETKTVTDAPGTYTTLTISGTWSQTPADGEVCAIGKTGVLTKPFRVIAIERTQDMTARLTAVEYDAALYDDSISSVNQVNYSALNALPGPVPAVTELQILQLDSVLNAVWVSFKPPSHLNYTTTRLYRTINGVDFLIGESREGTFPIANLKIGELVTVKASTVSTTGAMGALSLAPTASIVVSSASPPNVTGFSYYWLDGHARLFWSAVTWPRSVEYELRVGTAWASAILLGRTAFTTTDAAGNGTYWIAAYDPITRTYSATPASLVLDIRRIVAGETLIENIVQTRDEADLKWPGTVSGGAVVDVSLNAIILGGTTLFDAWADVDAILNFDFEGGVQASGSYEIPAAGIVDLGTVKPAHVMATYAGRGDTTLATFDAIQDFDAEPNLDGNYGEKVSLGLSINTDVGAGFTGWRKFVPGEHVFQKVKLRADLDSRDVGVTAVLTALQWTVDMPDRIESAADVALPAGGSTITFSPAFQAAPNVQITVQNGQSGDYVIVTAKTTTGFTVQILNGGVGIARTIDWTAKGY